MAVTSTHTSDETLVALAADGDTDAFSVLITRYAPAMRAYAKRFDVNAADDIVQESLLTAWKKIDQLENPSAIKSWLMSTTARKALDYKRRQKPYQTLEQSPEPVASTACPVTEAIASEGLDSLEQIIAKLPESQRNVWILREFGGLSYQEIAHELGISQTAVRGRLSRARQILVEAMEGWR